MTTITDVRRKQAIQEMEAALALVRAFTDLIEGKHHFSEGGWIDLYCYEPLETGKKALRKVVSSLIPLLIDGNWEWRLFGCDGLIATWADGAGAGTMGGDYIDLFEDKE